MNMFLINSCSCFQEYTCLTKEVVAGEPEPKKGTKSWAQREVALGRPKTPEILRPLEIARLKTLAELEGCPSWTDRKAYLKCLEKGIEELRLFGGGPYRQRLLDMWH